MHLLYTVLINAIIIDILCIWEVQTLRYPNTHTHTHSVAMLFFMVHGDSPYRRNVFILYKLYVLLPYTYPTPKLHLD